MQFLKREFNLFFLALGFFSRIPMPSWVTYSPENLNRSSRYFTLVGWLLGALVSAVFYVASLLFSLSISLWLTMVVSLVLTGAFHEDGLADTADGFGGGFNRDKKLSIMKDSRIGTYGAAALIMALLGKYLLLIENAHIVLALLVGYALSRTLAASLLFDMRYVADENASKSKPLANNQSSVDLLILCCSTLPAFFLIPWKTVFLLCGSLIVCRYIVRWYFNKQIGGYTGDCLGAAQQVAELMIYAVLSIQLSGSL